MLYIQSFSRYFFDTKSLYLIKRFGVAPTIKANALLSTIFEPTAEDVVLIISSLGN